MQPAAECPVLIVGREQGVGVVLIGVEFVVAVGVLAVKMAGAHTLCQQQFVEKTDWLVGNRVRDWQQVVRVLFRSVVSGD